jgi:hypothetical protein
MLANWLRSAKAVRFNRARKSRSNNSAAAHSVDGSKQKSRHAAALIVSASEDG